MMHPTLTIGLTEPEFEKFLEELGFVPNKFQIAAMRWIAFPSERIKQNLSIVARAGSGKTTLIYMCEKLLLYIAKTKNINAPRIGVLVFNKSGELTLSSRLKTKDVFTTHAFGNQTIRNKLKRTQVEFGKTRDAVHAVFPKYTDEMESADGEALNLSTLEKQIATAVAISINSMQYPIANPDAIKSIIENWNIRFEHVADDSFSLIVEKIIPETIEKMHESFEKKGSVSGEEQLVIPLVNNLIEKSFDILFGDEAQDWNLAQQLIAARCAETIVTVFDDRQSIYAFTGADSKASYRLPYITNSQVMSLPISYRNAKKIVAMARALVPDGTFYAREDADEGTVEVVGNNYLDMLKHSTMVIGRNNAEVGSAFIDAFLDNEENKKGLKLRILGADISAMVVGIVDEIKKLKKYDDETKTSYSMIDQNNIHDFLDYVDVWKRYQLAIAFSMHSKSVAKAEEREESAKSNAELLTKIYNGMKNPRTIKELISKVYDVFGKYSEEEEKMKNLDNYVTFTTAHKAKGLEANTVIIIATDKFMASRDGNTFEQETQEKNLAYVAMTRPRHELYFVNAVIGNIEPVIATEEKEMSFAVDTTAPYVGFSYETWLK